jgi:hypothetical protein
VTETVTNQQMVDGLGARTVSVGGWPNDTILLVMAYSKTEQYLPAIRQNLDLFWPGRPRTLYVTDGEVSGSDVVQAKGTSFVELLAAASAAIRERFPDATNAFVLLEDLCPLWPVDEAAMSRAQDLVRRHQKKFICHNWKARITDRTSRYDHWDGPLALKDDKITLFLMPKDCEFFNCLVASFWNLDHLDHVLAVKCALDLHDPWSFELPLPDNEDDHFMFEGIWPVAIDGFSARGKINSESVARRGFPASPLLSQLRKKYCGVDSYHLAALKRAWFRLGRSISKRVRRLFATSPSPMITDCRR